MTRHELQAFLREEEFASWIREFLAGGDLRARVQDGPMSFRELESFADLSDAGPGQPLLWLGSRLAAGGRPGDASAGREHVMIMCPLETPSVVGIESRALIESSLCGTTTACLLMARVAARKDPGKGLFAD